jgi:hypothetical protein
MKVIIAGGRDFNDYNTLRRICDHMLQNQNEIEVVSGKASGADYLGERYAKEKGYKIKEYPAKWNDMSEPCVKKKRKDGSFYNALAGHKRNQEMADYADALIAFHNGKSTGTADMIDRAKKANLKLKIHNCEY